LHDRLISEELLTDFLFLLELRDQSRLQLFRRSDEALIR
jgi:hypothetical protein